MPADLAVLLVSAGLRLQYRGNGALGKIGISGKLYIILGLFSGVMADPALAADHPVGFPGPLPPSLQQEGKTASTVVVSPLPPDNWPEEGGGPSRNPVFMTIMGKKEEGPGWTRTFRVDRLPGETDAPPENFYAGVVESGGILWMAGLQGDILAISAKDGSLIWRRHLRAPLPSPPVVGPFSVYLAASEPGVTLPHLVLYSRTRTLVRGQGPGLVEALSKKSGVVRWSVQVPGGCYGSPVLLPHTIMVQTGSGHLLFLDRRDGHTVYDMLLDGRSLGLASPVRDDLRVVVAQENPPLYQDVSLSGPRRLWRFGWSKTRDWEHFFIGTPLLAGKTLVGILRRPDLPGDQVVAINPDQGRVLWSLSFPPGDLPPAGDQALPVVSGDVVYVPSGVSRSLMAVDLKTGKALWTLRLTERPSTGGAVTGNLLLLPLPSGRLLAIDIRTGSVVGERRVAGHLGPHPPVVVGNRVFVGGEDGTVSRILLDEWGKRIRDLVLLPVSSPVQVISKAAAPSP